MYRCRIRLCVTKWPWLCYALVYVKCPLHIGLLNGVDIGPLHIYNSPEVAGVFLWGSMGTNAVAVAVKENSL